MVSARARYVVEPIEDHGALVEQSGAVIEAGQVQQDSRMTIECHRVDPLDERLVLENVDGVEGRRRGRAQERRGRISLIESEK